MREVDLAYIAGLMDGEAYIGIKKSKPTNGRLTHGYHERIQIRMVDEPAISFIAESLGGNYYKEKPSVANGRPLYCYQASDKKAARILELILPYLRVKKENAETVLKLRKRKDNPHKAPKEVECLDPHGNMHTTTRYRLSDQEIAERSWLYLECKRLNQTGKEA